VKGVTFCGDSTSSPLTMKNVPYHEDVVQFSITLAETVNKIIGKETYAVACEHAHSCCVCISNVRFRTEEGEWRTWIDYEKFQDCWKEWKENGTPFNKLQYTLPSPKWSLFQSQERGFDPVEQRVQTKGSGKNAGC